MIGGLAWWGREFSRPPAGGREVAADSAPRGQSELNISGSKPPNERSIAAESSAGEAEPRAAGTSGFPRTIPVSSIEDLHEVLAGAARGSVIVLADDGPYRVSGRAWSARTGMLAPDPDLTIKAEAGVRPVLKLAEGAGAGQGGPSSLLDFVGGHVVLEGIEFELRATGEGEARSAIRCEDTELVLRGCSFRRRERAAKDDHGLSAIVVRAARRRDGGAERPPAVFADSCHFDGGQVAVKSAGPADITLRDCTLGPAGPSIWFDEARSEWPLAGELRLIHTSILAGLGPVFRFAGGPVRVRVDDCVIAPAGRAGQPRADRGPAEPELARSFQPVRLDRPLPYDA